ncbi:GL13636 [Drosophila persimilis]|uniref:GL13636 n=1 Tax=Drosophila persimilis TaxID=7234 RepID=B4HD33_DROPE|nr:GL13636 [Drosophila persimilis]
MSVPYRLCALRVVSGYETVSDNAALVLAAMIPVDILALEMTHVYEARAGMRTNASLETIRASERRASIEKWQARWDTATNRRWTHRLIPDIESWIGRRSGEMNYHLTQFLTGHGGYRKYLHRFKHEDTPECPECSNESEDPEHVIYHCTRYRSSAEYFPRPEELMAFMTESDENWQRVSNTLIAIQSDLRRCERERRGEESA